MSILVVCPCGSQQRLPTSYEGKDVKCLKCGVVTRAGVTGALYSERRLQVGDISLVARCEPSQIQQADAVLKKLVTNSNLGVGLGDKVRIPLGWSELVLQKRGSELFVCEADYSRNPWSDVREDISVVIHVGWGQGDLARKLSVKPMACTFSQSLQIATGCFEDPELLMRRIKPPKGEDSGWFIGPTDDEKLAKVHERGEYEQILSYQLLALRPGMLPALILPLGYCARYSGDTLLTVTDGEFQVIFSSQPAQN